MLFWSFIFPETYIYYRSCIYLKRYKKKCAQQLSYGFNILDKLEGWTQEKNSLWGSAFFEFCMQKYRILRKEFLSKFLRFSEISFKRISFEKLTPEATLG